MILNLLKLQRIIGHLLFGACFPKEAEQNAIVRVGCQHAPNVERRGMPTEQNPLILAERAMPIAKHRSDRTSEAGFAEEAFRAARRAAARTAFAKGVTCT
jgi:hypothetical protein